MHDRGYGHLDRLPIGEIDEETWLAITRKGFYMPSRDPVAKVITRVHLKRLVSLEKSPARHGLLSEMEMVIEAQLDEHGLPRDVFEHIDCISDFCDRVSFDFSEEYSGYLVSYQAEGYADHLDGVVVPFFYRRETRIAWSGKTRGITG